MLSGTLEVDGIEYNFEYENWLLNIIPKKPIPLNKNFEDSMTNSIDKGRTLKGYTYKGKCIVFLNISIKSYSIFPNIDGFTLSVGACYVFRNKEQPIDKMYLYGKELDYIYSIRKAYKTKITEYKSNNTMEALVYLNKDTKSNSHYVKILDRNIEFYFGIESRLKAEGEPFRSETILSIKFEPNCDYTFLFKTYLIFESFIKTLCYRDNIDITNIKLYNKDIGLVGELYYQNKYKSSFQEDEKKLKSRLIKYDDIKDGCNILVQTIADEQFPLWHIPNDSKDDHYITPSRILLITSAFECIYKVDLKPNKNSFLNEIIDFITNWKYTKNKQGKRFADKLIAELGYMDYSLESKCLKAFKEYKDLITPFKEKYYTYATNPTNFKEIAYRIGLIRNKNAHGNIDCKVDLDYVYDIILLQRLIYIIILQKSGVSKHSTVKAISDLFESHVTLDKPSINKQEPIIH